MNVTRHKTMKCVLGMSVHIIYYLGTYMSVCDTYWTLNLPGHNSLYFLSCRKKNKLNVIKQTGLDNSVINGNANSNA